MDFSSEQDHRDWWEKLQNQRQHGQFCDIVFHVGSREFPAHRNILAASSPYFSSVFNHMNVAKEHITVPCQNPDVMEQLLRFVYLGKVTINQLIVLDLLKLSSTYLLSFLKGYCRDFLQANLNLNNCLTAYEYADRYVLHDLKDLAEDYIKKNITFIVVGNELLKYSFEQIASFLWNKKWNVDDNSKFVSVCHWVNMDPKSYSRYFSELLSNIWLSRITVQVIQEVFDVCPMFIDNQMKKTVFDAMAVQNCMPEQFQELSEKLSTVDDTSSPDATSSDVYNTKEESTGSQDEDQVTHLAMVNITTIDSDQSEKADGKKAINSNNDAVKSTDDSQDNHSVLSIEANTKIDSDNVKAAVLQTTKEANTETDQEEPTEAVSSQEGSDPDYHPEECDEITEKVKIKREPKVGLSKSKSTRMSASKSRSTRGPIPRLRIKLKDVPPVNLSKRKQSVPMKVKKTKKRAKKDISESETDTEGIRERKRKKLFHRRVMNQVYICELCCFKTTCEERFKKHEIQAHKDGVVFKCHRCDYESCWNREYYRHMKIHYSGPPYECEEEECDYVGDRIQFLLLHRMKHTNERPFECTVCNSKFRNKWTLTTHLKIHTGEKPYVCPICNQSFGTKGTMQQHMVSHSDARPYLCDICGFTTKYQSHLTTHKRIHTGNVFRCTVCDYFTPKRNQLQNHMKIHLSIRSFVCSTCGRAFTEKSHMVRHERIHTTDKPFKCDKCEYASNRRDKLKEHIVKHHTPGVVCKTPYRPRRPRKTPAPVPVPKEGEQQVAAPGIQIQVPEHPIVIQPTPGVQVYPNNDASKHALHPQSLYLGYNTDGMLLASQMLTSTDSTVDTSQLLGLTHIGQPNVPVSLTEGQVVDPRLLTHMMAPMQPQREIIPAHQHASTPPMNQQPQVSHVALPQTQTVQNPDSVAYITLSKY